ncbi:hypothetical protein [Tunicatimonas pelagia]|uniref:hypothetical protein n=1 Tax=Tunicatimonas pelagia TaxID=931531 RepID=UPI002666B414|nr:hypothetical protein [Tunicatimonas pelagia]WKN44406.1 hypothetical protein P0M28_05440 [Tunicatimonas pelagia]
MNRDSQNDDKFDRYLRDEMDTEERQAFEDLLNEDESLKAEVSLQQDITAGIDLFGSEALKKQLQQAEELASTPTPLTVPQKKSEKKSNTAVRPLYFILATAASFALVLIAVWLLNPAASSQELYATYFEPYPNVVNPVERSGGVPTDAAGQAMYYYEQGDYEQAIRLFAQAPNEEAYQFYWGVSYLGAGQAWEAEIKLEPLLHNAQGLFYEPALWYTSLAQIQSEQLEAAVASLQQLVSMKGEYAVDAQALLEEL